MYSASTSSLVNAEERDAKVLGVDSNPLDTIQTITWDRNETTRFIAGGWDGILRIYTIQFNPLGINQADAYYLEDPILGSAMDCNNYIAFTGHTDGHIKMISLQARQTAILGKLPAPVKDLYWCYEINSLIAVTIDCHLTFWQTSNIGAPVFSVQLPHKTVVSAFDYPYLLLGSSDEKMCILRVDQPNAMNVNTYIDSPLGQFCKLMSADVSASSKGWLICSMDGRGNYGNFRDLPAGVDCRDTVVCFKAQKRE